MAGPSKPSSTAPATSARLSLLAFTASDYASNGSSASAFATACAGTITAYRANQNFLMRMQGVGKRSCEPALAGTVRVSLRGNPAGQPPAGPGSSTGGPVEASHPSPRLLARSDDQV